MSRTLTESINTDIALSNTSRIQICVSINQVSMFELASTECGFIQIIQAKLKESENQCPNHCETQGKLNIKSIMLLKVLWLRKFYKIFIAM